MEQIFQLLFKETKSLSSEEFDDMKLSSNFSYDDAVLVNGAQTSMVSGHISNEALRLHLSILWVSSRINSQPDLAGWHGNHHLREVERAPLNSV